MSEPADDPQSSRPSLALGPSERLRRLYALVAVALGAAVVALLLLTSDAGYARDEGFYFYAAKRYGEWFVLLVRDRGEALRRAAIDAHFVVNHEHPALAKSLFAVSHLADRRLGLFAEPGTAFRFPAMVLAGVMTAITFHWGVRARGAVTGVVAALSLIFMPRVFFHAHLACFDVPITALFVATFYAYDRTLKSSGWLWPALTGLSFGLALSTKHNSWFLPIAFAAHASLLALMAWRSRQSLRTTLRRPLAALLTMATIGPLVLFATWPWLWFDTWARLKEYASFHVNHEYYNMEFLGENYWQPPFPRGYAPIMTVATVPLVTLVAAAFGTAALGRDALRDLRAREPEVAAEHATLVLWALGVAVSYGPWLSSGTPIFGGTKHWMTAYPFLALFAGAGVERAASVIREELELVGAAGVGRVVAPACVVLALASPVFQSLAAHPWGLSAYTPIVGGAPGAASLGLNRTFWGYTTGSLTDTLNRELPPGGRVYPHDTAGASWEMLQRDGRLRKDLRAVGRADDADVALYHHELHMQGQEYQAWVAYGTVQPVVVSGLDGVPVVWAYKRRRP
ncbi:MAG: glycosyltransferase family 39 protein [Polyangiaceae bacterium]|jgi:hypothetical protein|nr:glycosyltransferase family 39 protein [Polyangiaceae bacterium]